jgi:hypothetical protein
MSYGSVFRTRPQGVGVEEVMIAPRSLWQNPVIERVDQLLSDVPPPIVGNDAPRPKNRILARTALSHESVFRVVSLPGEFTSAQPQPNNANDKPHSDYRFPNVEVLRTGQAKEQTAAPSQMS